MNDLETAVRAFFTPIVDDAATSVIERTQRPSSEAVPASALDLRRHRHRYRRLATIPALAAAAVVVILIGLPTLFLWRPVHTDHGRYATALGPTPRSHTPPPPVPDGSPACSAAQLSVSLSNDIPAGGYQQIEVAVTNASDIACHVSRNVQFGIPSTHEPSSAGYDYTAALKAHETGTVIVQNSRCATGEGNMVTEFHVEILQVQGTFDIALPHGFRAGASCPMSVSPLVTHDDTATMHLGS